MRGMGLDLYSGLTSVDSTYFNWGIGQSDSWLDTAIRIGTGIYQEVAGPQNPYYYPPYSGTYPYYPASQPTNWLPWILIGGAVLLVAAANKKK